MLERAATFAPEWKHILEAVESEAASATPAPREWRREGRVSIRGEGSGETAFALGKRKTSTARVWVSPVDKGNHLGRMIVNGREHVDYFPQTCAATAVTPLLLTGMSGKYNVNVRVQGGGLSGALWEKRGLVSHLM